MLSIQTLSIEKKDNLSVYNLNYPIIKSENEKNIINHINKKIYEDIMAFKSEIDDRINTMPGKQNYLSCVNTDYYVTYNDNDIISIPIEFSQLDGLYNISYINSYNYDINLEKEINIGDIFNPGVDYIEIITKQIKNRIKELSKELSIDKYIMVLDYLKDIVLSDNPTFYISKDSIVICFSSYELDPTIQDISTFRLPIEENKQYLSKYILNKVLND